MKTLVGFLGVVAISASLAAPVDAQACSFISGPDVIVGSLNGVSNYSAVGGVEALSLGTTSCNLGDTNLSWISGNNQHPVIGGNLYRLKDYGGWWAMEHVGMSWLKHGFFALSQSLCCSNCSSTSGSALGTGCSDPYTSGRNGSQGGLGPRWQVNANSGFFNYPPANPGWSGSSARRLQVATSDLEPTSSTTTRYYGEGHYVTPDDASWNNNDNNASYRRMTVSGSGSSWTFGFNGGTVREKAAIHAWGDSGVDPNVVLQEFDIGGEGHYIVAFSVTDLGSSTYHYEFAVYNMNSDDSFNSFELPIPTGVVISNPGFHDVTYRNGDGQSSINRDGTDWAFTQSATSIRWSGQTQAENNNANALRWGSTFNFRFDASTPPAGQVLTLGIFKGGGSTTAVVRGPSAPPNFGNQFCNSSDGSLAACPCSNPGNPDSGCDNVQGTGGVFMEATAFAPNGGGGGTATFTGTDFSAAGSPTYVLIRSTTQIAAVAAFDGAICLGGSVTRVGSGFAVGGTAVEPYTHGAMAAPGTNYYQLWYRNQPAAFCTPDAANLSNGYDLTW